MEERAIASIIFSRKVRPRNGKSAFGRPIRSDFPAARTIAEYKLNPVPNFLAPSPAGQGISPSMCNTAGSERSGAARVPPVEQPFCATRDPGDVRRRMRQLSDVPRKNPLHPLSCQHTESRNRRYGGSGAWLLY